MIGVCLFLLLTCLSDASSLIYLCFPIITLCFKVNGKRATFIQKSHHFLPTFKFSSTAVHFSKVPNASSRTSTDPRHCRRWSTGCWRGWNGRSSSRHRSRNGKCCCSCSTITTGNRWSHLENNKSFLSVINCDFVRN